MTILGAVNEVALSAEKMTAKFQTRLSANSGCSTRSPPQQPQHRMPQPRALDDALPPISAHHSKLHKILASRTADWYLNDFNTGVLAHSLQRRSWSRRWYTPSLYGIQQDGASMGAMHQISFTTISRLVVSLWRNVGVTRDALPRLAQERALACKAHSWCPAKLCEHYNAKLLLLRKKKRNWAKLPILLRKLRKTIKYSKTMKSRKHNDGITHINNRLKQDTLPIKCLTSGAATPMQFEMSAEAVGE